MSTAAAGKPRRIEFLLNDGRVALDAKPGLVVADYLRNGAGLKGTKVGCKEGDCGACTVIVGSLINGAVDYRIVTSCLLPVGELHGKHLVTIEGLNRNSSQMDLASRAMSDELTLVQQVIVAEGATQCGFCTPGIVVALTGFLLGSGPWDDDRSLAAVAGNICRCTGYAAIKRAAARLVRDFSGLHKCGDNRIGELVRLGIVPAYFGQTKAQLASIAPDKRRAGIGERQVVVGGGTDLFVQQPEQLEDAELVFLAQKQLGEIWSDEKHLYLGAGATVAELERSELVAEYLPAIARFAKLISSEPIRNRATVGGNIVNASPIGDLSILLLALDAELGLKKGRKNRRLSLRRFFLGYKQLDLEAGEIIEWVRIPSQARSASVNFEKVCKRTHLDIASVNSAFSVTVGPGDGITSAHLAIGGVAPVPLYLAKTSEYFIGRSVSVATAREAAGLAVAELEPISDVRGSSEYKRALAGRLVLAHFSELFGLSEGLL